ncbi:ATP-binding protein [Secundilactobacillus paracollinoides]|uniref:ATP-binding protein n=1 Tax=Secundilactobacillus paracollinoides TaxID=240427 RepID=UPI0006D0321F|nr:ATP-binding protein [Secundilactobacillus paracollinoides]
MIISDIENGLVAARNPRLVHILDKMGYLENYGTGLKRIVKAYAQSDLRPEIKVTENSFLVTLPNLNG